MRLNHGTLLPCLYFVVNGLLYFAHQYRASLLASYLFTAIGTIAVCRDVIEQSKIRIVTR